MKTKMMTQKRQIECKKNNTKNINNIVMVINKSFIVTLNEEGNHMGASVAREE